MIFSVTKHAIPGPYSVFDPAGFVRSKKDPDGTDTCHDPREKTLVRLHT